MIGNINRIDFGESDEEKNIDTKKLRELQRKDPFCSLILDVFDEKNVSTIMKRKSRQFCTQNNTLYYKKYITKIQYLTLVVLMKMIKFIFTSYHKSPIGGHTGITRTIHQSQSKYYWPSLNKDTTNFVKLCHMCQINKKNWWKTNRFITSNTNCIKKTIISFKI